MQITDILRHKGRHVTAILPNETVETATRLLAEKRIGAVLVRDRRGKVVGILSERDIVRRIADKGAAALALKVQELMTSDVKTCKPTDTVKEVMSVMTLRRIRHLPVMDGEELAGLVSIGDVVKSRLDEQAHEAAVYRDLSLVKG
ncbi:MAG TPA: CBS domain-containing protein [Azospirillaceae bacterium]|nr:CBS domain-containing protein [Azospirillaceae bacterium]